MHKTEKKKLPPNFEVFQMLYFLSDKPLSFITDQVSCITPPSLQIQETKLFKTTTMLFLKKEIGSPYAMKWRGG